jgi:hypothetical protein
MMIDRHKDLLGGICTEKESSMIGWSICGKCRLFGPRVMMTGPS